ncbi:hypothetical protein KKB40_01260 [Patescibacteria group bacterium]|nr:hypothetical protein [Patescibacteria group bacterium]
MRRKLTLAIAAIALIGAIGYGTTVAIVRASEEQSHPMVQVLAEKFGLNEDEVRDAFDEVRADHFAQMQTRREERLNQAVEDGVISESQKQVLLERREEMKANREQHREEMQVWFAEQGIDHEALMQYMGGFKKHGRFGGMKGFAE